MSNFRFRNLDKFTTSKRGDKRTMSMKRPQTGTGKVQEKCFNPKCQPAVFFIGQAPDECEIADVFKSIIRREPGTEGITCPYCGIDGDDQDFIAEQDVEHAQKEIMHAVEKDFGDMLGDMAKSFNRGNRSSRNSMFSITMEHKSTHRPRPRAYRVDLLRDISCHVCKREYGVYALALFCPDCGSPNVSTHFDREIELIKQQIEISKLIDSNENKEVAYRLLANAHEDTVTALETTLKAVYRYLILKHHPDKEKKLEKVGNAFQNLGRAELMFKEININLLDDLSDQEKGNLVKAIQKRHVIGHNLGLADEKYTLATGKTDIGKNVPLLAEEIEAFALTCVKLIHAVEKELNNDS